MKQRMMLGNIVIKITDALGGHIEHEKTRVKSEKLNEIKNHKKSQTNKKHNKGL